MKKTIIICFISILTFSNNYAQNKTGLKKEEKRETPTKVSIPEKLYTEKELRLKSKEELSLIRNEIFARKGYVFTTPELQRHFEKKEWYKPQANKDIELSEVEKQNIDLIKKIESEYHCVNEIVNALKVKTLNNDLGSDSLDIRCAYEAALKDFILNIDVGHIINSPDKEYAKPYYLKNFHGDDVDKTQDRIVIRFDISEKYFMIQINTTATGEGWASDISEVFLFEFDDKCNYKFKEHIVAG